VSTAISISFIPICQNLSTNMVLTF